MRTTRLTTVNNSVEAHILADRLKDAGIDCAIHNENMSNVFGGLFCGFTGIDIFVFEDELDKAKALLEQSEE